MKPIVEQCWTLVGAKRGRIWLCPRVRWDGAGAAKREETHGDGVGLLHAHPDRPAVTSARDVRTMRAWCLAFGKPLVCLIASPDGLRGYRFDDEESTGEPLAIVEVF